VLAAFVAWAASAPGREAITAWAKDRGLHRFDRSTSFYRGLAALPWRALAPVDAPRLELLVAPKHWRALAAMRGAALQKGLIEDSEQEEVPGRLRVHGEELPIDLRLKGDYTDHLQGDKWSFRIAIGGDAEFGGMRRFSVQDPRTKGFHGEVLLFATLRHLQVLAPRYRFVTAALNGADLGVMAVEEHVGKELLESQGRRDGPVVHLDEAMFFAGRDDYREAGALVFGQKRLQKDPVFAAQTAVAVDLLRAFVDGVQPAGHVFAVEPLAGFLAATTFWGSWHGVRWHNLRFAFDPVAQRLEPIGFDGNLQMHRPLPSIVVHEEDLLRRVLADEAVLTAFHRRLRELCRAVDDGRLVRELQAAEAGALPILRKEFWLLEPFPLAELRERAAFFGALPLEALRPPGVPGPLDLGAWTSAGALDATLELHNRGGEPVRVTAVRWVSRDSRGGRLSFQPRDAAALPLSIAPGGTASVRGLLCADASMVIELEFACGDAGGRTIVQRAPTNPRPTGRRSIPDSTAAEQAAAHPFLQLDAAARRLHVRAGSHAVAEHLVVPREHVLVVDAGAELRFAPGKALIAHGALDFAGTAAAPVRLRAQGERDRWLGVAVIGAPPSTWSHVLVTGTAGVTLGAWTLTGAVTFAQSECTLRSCTFADTVAEDALNAISTRVEIEDCAFVDTASDAFDGDFVAGRIAGCRAERIGGDAFDISGADLDVARLQCRDVRDKALSVGERSVARASGIAAERVGTGIACKDGSTLELRDAAIDQPTVAGVMAYCKKPEFGSATVRAAGVRVTGAAPHVLVEDGSVVVLDGAEQATQPLDVDRLYATVMRKK
jgi:hypothetical protein